MGRKKVLILCTGNSCRSQMAEGLAREAGWQAFSAGTKPEMEVNPSAVTVMAEIGIDISHHIPQSVNEFLNEDFELVATVCDNAQKSCPVFNIRPPWRTSDAYSVSRGDGQVNWIGAYGSRGCVASESRARRWASATRLRNARDPHPEDRAGASAHQREL